MTRLLDLGIDRIRNLIMDMSEISERSVITAIESYEKGSSVKKTIFNWSEQLRVLQDEVSDLAIELIARYQPVATDLRFIRSCMEIAYGFSRFGRYAYDIVDVLETMGSVGECDKSAVLEMSSTAREMIRMSVLALRSKDKDAAQQLYKMDDTVDALYRKYLREALTPPHSTANKDKRFVDPRCYISALLILRYLERIADHACYIADSVHYIVTGESSPRR
ncbi:putative phosphate uptake regulator, PhoU [Candidatus Nitrososphaera gargensis Ga9.2]|uniref:Phosphate-specific transport system accessory protein PhoU n=1 Tax=Nitrososphaera gargensis (strain Ga9.2) TaxID=1237085 RepID=K0I9B5_NITGG|nr:phosphate uptake regulator PhoU [Candidatus Nitrososphaera gargensis]AFU57926.1 putative phosphate uptake regulator, PhoU [Candidatus Nitrososphaera gargensis Ga9.2]